MRAGRGFVATHLVGGSPVHRAVTAHRQDGTAAVIECRPPAAALFAHPTQQAAGGGSEDG